MKRLLLLLLVSALALCCCACGENGSIFNREYTLPEGTTVAGIDLTGRTKEAAWDQIKASVKNYKMQLSVDGHSFEVQGKDFGLSCSETDFAAAMDALEAKTEPDFSKVICYDEELLRPLLDSNLNRPARDAAIVYDEAAGAYRIEPHAEGMETDLDALMPMVKDAILTLQSQHRVDGFGKMIAPQWTADMPEAQAALSVANSLAVPAISYDFGSVHTPNIVEIPAEVIRSFITMGDDGFTPAVDPVAVEAYVAELAAQYDTEPGAGKFPTTSGKELDVVISYNGCYLDTSAMAKDIVLRMQYGISGVRNAIYLPDSARGIPFGGTYVEVDLDNQHMWFYKDGKLLTDSDLVSGSVAARAYTPNGVFRIYSRSRSTYLVGVDYRSYVNYWMPFYRAYGLHDATWRDEFGGDIYLDDGSHGCVNLPLEKAGILFENSVSGVTRVVIHGGEGAVPMKEQILLGKTEYTVTPDEEPFELNIHSKYVWPDYYYESDNPQVATVDESGLVTVTGNGTAHITVTCSTESIYHSASITVTVNVQPE